MKDLTLLQKELYKWLVDYTNSHQHSPSVRQMMQGMRFKSPASVQSLLKQLTNKGYIERPVKTARIINILHSAKLGTPVLGEINADGMIKIFNNTIEYLDFSNLALPAKTYALRINNDKMSEDLIANGDIIFLLPIADLNQLKDGAVVIASIDKYGAMLRRFYRKSDRVTLKSMNSQNFIEIPLSQVQIHGSLVGAWRNCVGAT